MACYPANIGLPGKGVDITYLCKRVFVSINFTHAKQMSFPMLLLFNKIIIYYVIGIIRAE
jgi:hypothetical protein